MMMTLPRTTRCAPLLLFVCGLLCPVLRAQAPSNTAQQLVFAGLRSVAQQGQINAIKTDASGNLYLLLSQGDGVRILKTDNNGSGILAQALLGASGDVGTALALDPTGNVFVTGTTSSTTLASTSSAAIPNRTDSSTQSFVAKFDPNLNPLFVTFTGGSRIASSAISATADAVFVTGILYGSNLPVTPNGIQQAPAYNSSQSGFVEKFSTSGTTLLYATYLTGAAGSTTPAAIVADSADNAYITGATSASGFPTIAALVPAILGNPSGFLTKLTPAGDGITFSTFIPGAGLNSIALDSAGQTLLLSGSVALGQFPVDTVTTPLIPTIYQVLLRIPIAGNAVTSATVIAPGTQSSVAAAPSAGAWIAGQFDGQLTIPFLPLTPLAAFGNGFAVHATSSGAIDQTARLGGLPTANPTYASLPAVITSLAVDPTGNAFPAGAIQPTASSSLLASETYDLPLRATPTSAFPSAVSDAELTAASCNGSLCAGSAAYLSKLAPISAAALSFSANAVPFIVLRNLGTTSAASLQLTPSTGTQTNNCPSTLPPGGECDILLSGGAAGSLTASSSTAAYQFISYPAFSSTAPTATIAFYPKELDFGIQTSTSPAATRTITVSNLGTSSQTFTSALDTTATPKSTSSSPFFEQASDCTNSGVYTSMVLAPGGTCHITIGLTVPSTATSDGILNADWLVGSHDVLLTAYSQAAALSVSASEIDFGTQYTNGVHLPRYLYLSNPSANPLSHAALSLPTGSPFTLTDACPATLLANSICRIRIDYLAAKSTSTDSATLTLDQSLSVLITGATLPPPGTSGSSSNPNLSVTPASESFTNAVAVTAVSSTTQTVTISNTGASAFALTLALTGDFTDATGCAPTLGGGQSCTVVLSFVPSQPGTRQGLLSITAGSSSPTYVALSGTGSAILPANNGTLSSGSIAVGQPTNQFYKVSQPFNPLTASTTGPFTVILVEDVGFGPGQPPTSSYTSAYAGSCHNCYLGIQYIPTAVGVQTGSLTLTSTPAGSPYILALTGTGLATSGLLLTPLTQDFGTAPVHSTSGSQLFTLTNLTSGGAPVTIAAPTLTGDFAFSSATTGATPCGGTLAYTASCSVEVAFTPTAAGTRTGTLTFSTSTASASATLTGLATADPGLAISPLALSFNAVPGNSSTTQTVSLTNTGSASLTIGTPTAATPYFRASSACSTLAPSASCTLTVNFLATTASVADTLSIPVTSAGVTSTYTVTLGGNYTTTSSGLEIVPGQTQYAPITVGSQSVPRQFTINNLTAKSVTLNISIPRQFVLTGAPCGGLAPNASCTFSVAFAPLTNGSISGSLYAQGTPSDGSATLAGIGYLEGYGIGSGTLTLTGALITNGVYSFGQVTSGQTVAQTFTLSNLNPGGSSPITIRRLTSQPPFLSTSNCAAPLAVGQTCTFTVTYAPSNQVATGTSSPAITSDSGGLLIESDATNSTSIVDLTGQAGPVAVTAPSPSGTLATFSLSQSSLTFASTAAGNVSAPQTLMLANTGSITIHITSLFTSTDFTLQSACGTLVPGATCSVAVTATPQTSGIHLASLEIASDAATSLEFASLLVTGTPSALTLSPTALNFGSLLVGGAATQPVVVTNSSASPVTFNSISLTGDYAFTGNCPTAGASMAAGATCTLQVTFSPLTSGIRAGTLSLANSASTNPLTVTLTGIGLQPQLSITPSPLAFGNVALGTSATLGLTLRNNGTVAIDNLALTATGDYTVSVPCPSPTLAAGSSCAVQITFTPSALGARNATLTATSSDPGSPASIPLTGTGTQGGSFTLTVNSASSASVSTISGVPATYQVTVTPTGGFTGTVALTCTPVVAAQYASCSLLPSSVTLSGAAQGSVVTINTITSFAANVMPAKPGSVLNTIFMALLFPGLVTLWRGRSDLRARRLLLIAFCVSGSIILAIGCGGSSSSTPAVASSNTLYTPAGTYQYQVTASSTSGVQATQTVTLNLTVTPR